MKNKKTYDFVVIREKTIFENDEDKNLLQYPQDPCYLVFPSLESRVQFFRELGACGPLIYDQFVHHSEVISTEGYCSPELMDTGLKDKSFAVGNIPLRIVEALLPKTSMKAAYANSYAEMIDLLKQETPKAPTPARSFQIVNNFTKRALFPIASRQ